ncbi:MAG: alpha/beta hydrolase [Deltaproteobacteria bacterium]|nr:alpha/beta hydrolase [Deltaproteobacteria bacterium]
MARDIQIETVETPEMRFEVHSCGDPQSERLALCLHGFPEHAASWRYLLPVLGKLGYKAWAPNQRGYGATTRPSGVAAYKMKHLLDDVASLIDASGATSVTLIGHDWGGAVAWLFALQKVRPLERLIVMNLPHPQLFGEHLANNKDQQRRSRYERFFQLPWLPEFLFKLRGARAIGQTFRGMAVDKGRFPDETLDVYRKQALEPGAMTAMLNWYRANRFREICAGPFPILDVPTLMVWGDEDTALGKEMTLGTEELVRDFTLRYVHASHWVQQDAPEAVNEIVSAWLTGEPVPTFS